MYLDVLKKKLILCSNRSVDSICVEVRRIFKFKVLIVVTFNLLSCFRNKKGNIFNVTWYNV